MKQLNYIPLDNTKPPKAKSMTNANDPNVLATIRFPLPVTAIKRNNAEDIWFTRKSTRYCLNNLQLILI
jgi:hypothetical protein